MQYTFKGQIDHGFLQKELLSALGPQETAGWYLTGSQGTVTFIATKDTCPDPTAYIETHIANGGKNTRLEKWTKVKELRDRRILDSGVFVDGNWFFSDEPFRNVIAQACRIFPLDTLPDDDPIKAALADKLAELRGVPWKTIDGQFVAPSLTLAIHIDVAHALLTKNCHFNGERLRAYIDAAPDPALVEIHGGWPIAYYDISHGT